MASLFFFFGYHGNRMARSKNIKQEKDTTGRWWRSAAAAQEEEEEASP
jgi:hypothetical protein